MVVTRFADRIVAIRRALGLSREELARLVCVSASTVFRWETGKLTPSGPTANIVASLEIVINKGRAPKLKSLLQTGEIGTGPLAYHNVLSLAFD